MTGKPNKTNLFSADDPAFDSPADQILLAPEGKDGGFSPFDKFKTNPVQPLQANRMYVLIMLSLTWFVYFIREKKKSLNSSLDEKTEPSPSMPTLLPVTASHAMAQTDVCSLLHCVIILK